MRKLLFDFFPIILFFIGYKLYDIFIATAVLIVATGLQLTYELIKYKRVSPMHIITFVLVLILGGATIYFHDEAFIVWKVTVVNWVFAVIFICSSYFMDKPIIRRLMEESITLPKDIWLKLNNLWGLFFIFLGVINLVIYGLFSMNFWVNFKLFGMLGLTLIFVLGQGVYLSKHIKEEEK